MQSCKGGPARLWCAMALLGLVACSDAPPRLEPEVDAGAMDLPLGQDAGADMECEAVAPTTCPDSTLNYASVEPIFQARCVTCHDGKTEQWPLTNYQNIADWYDAVRSLVLDCAMPPPESGLTMTTAERNQILAWIQCGYRE